MRSGVSRLTDGGIANVPRIALGAVFQIICQRWPLAKVLGYGLTIVAVQPLRSRHVRSFSPTHVARESATIMQHTTRKMVKFRNIVVVFHMRSCITGREDAVS